MNRAFVVGVVLLAAGIGGFLYLRSGSDAPAPATAALESLPSTPSTEATSSGTQALPSRGQDVKAMDPDEWFRKQPDTVKASFLMGLGADYGGKGSLEAYFLDLERRIAAGDSSAVMPAAELLRTCSLLTGATAGAAGQEHPAKLVAGACQTMPAREAGYDRTLVATAAQKGIREAVLSEWGFPPHKVVYSRDLAVKREWATGVAGRLEVLAGKGNLEAQLLLGRAYVAEEFGLSDYAKAAEQFRAFLRSAPLSDPRRDGIQAFLARACAEGHLSGAGSCD